MLSPGISGLNTSVLIHPFNLDRSRVRVQSLSDKQRVRHEKPHVTRRFPVPSSISDSNPQDASKGKQWAVRLSNGRIFLAPDLMSAHEANHIGQIATWRRAMGLERHAPSRRVGCSPQAELPLGISGLSAEYLSSHPSVQPRPLPSRSACPKSVGRKLLRVQRVRHEKPTRGRSRHEAFPGSLLNFGLQPTRCVQRKAMGSSPFQWPDLPGPGCCSSREAFHHLAHGGAGLFYDPRRARQRFWECPLP